MQQITQTMKTYKFDGYASYTSHRGLAGSQEQAMEASDRALPDWIVLPDGQRLDWREEWKFAENRTKAGYVIFNGLKLKYEVEASPDYYKLHGDGNCIMKLTIKSELPLKFEFDRERP